MTLQSASLATLFGFTLASQQRDDLVTYLKTL